MNRRTLQRAEAGEIVSSETVAFIAAELGVRPEELHIPIDPEDIREPEARASDAVVLVPTSSGRKIIDAVRKSFDMGFSFDVEPRKDNVEVLAMLADLIKRVHVDPWQNPWEGDELSEADVLRLQADVNEVLEKRGQFGVRVFVGTYDARRQVPRLGDEGLYVRVGQPKEIVEVGLVVISDTSDTHLVRKPTDHAEHIPF